MHPQESANFDAKPVITFREFLNLQNKTGAYGIILKNGCSLCVDYKTLMGKRDIRGFTLVVADTEDEILAEAGGGLAMVPKTVVYKDDVILGTFYGVLYDSQMIELEKTLRLT